MLLCVRIVGRRWCSDGTDKVRRVTLQWKDEGRIADVVLSRGKKLNVMDERFFKELGEVFEEVSGKKEARVAVLSAEGKHFTAGLDLKAAAEMFFRDAGAVQKAKLAGAAVFGIDASITESGMPAMRAQTLHKLILSWQASISSLANCRVPVIAAIHGKCIGGGVDLITSADIRMCTSDASFSIKETEVGIVADLGTLQRITNIMGQGIVRELAFTGADLGSYRALQTGLVNSIHETQEELNEAAFEMARRIAANSPLAVQGTKEILNYPLDPVVTSGLKNVALHNSAFLKSDDLLKAVLSFIKKQPAVYGDYVVPKTKNA
eukprot:TRINITY_DN24747_c0_g1_i1.p1 TRINITY_DN24747_c0_g1~~TRINITY_DN24747_c0_g1_i1.p1  ORF type:complete len:332 (+),score=87.58 TRINITY_DN24747_c0_g1_i1:36-998(+)